MQSFYIWLVLHLHPKLQNNIHPPYKGTRRASTLEAKTLLYTALFWSNPKSSVRWEWYITSTFLLIDWKTERKRWSGHKRYATIAQNVCALFEEASWGWGFRSFEKIKEISSAKVCHRGTVQKIDLEKKRLLLGNVPLPLPWNISDIFFKCLGLL